MALLQGTLKGNKKALRKAIGFTLGALPAVDVQTQSQAITAKVLSSLPLQRCKSVSCYLSMPTGEVDTSSLVSEIISTGKTLFVPRITGDRMEFLRVYGEDDLRTFPSGIWGIKEPSTEWQGQRRQNVLDEGCEGLDVILLPGVAFDRSLSRLGHGKGYYDKFLSSYITIGRQRPLLVALSLREQLLASKQVPTDETDWQMDVIVSPDEVVVSEDSEPFYEA